MAININGNNYGIAVDGNLTIEHVNFGLGGGVPVGLGHPPGGTYRLPAQLHLRHQALRTPDDKLRALLAEIARSIDLGEYNAIYGPNEHGRINPSAKNEWYYILRPCWKLACADNLWATKSLWSR